jgi:ADP-ribose pyrophosphatase YjhB (NUDIX family)
MEPKWLVWAREMQAMAQTGLTFTKDAYDRARYERLRQLSADMMGQSAGVDINVIEELFAGQTGYATPKIDVREAVFKEGKILLVQERSDPGRWSLPGGWADVNRSPTECVVLEVREETGLEVSAVKLAAVYDRARHPHTPPFPFHVYKMFFICEIIGGVLSPGTETEAVTFFGANHLPELSVSRVLRDQIYRMFAHAGSPALPTEFD